MINQSQARRIQLNASHDGKLLYASQYVITPSKFLGHKQATTNHVFLAEDNQSGSIYVQERMSFACLVVGSPTSSRQQTLPLNKISQI